MIKVSIIVPCYNAESFLRKCLDSLVYQTLEDIEIICVNDVSTDCTADIIREYERTWPEKVRLINLETTQRAGGARNAGLVAARGEYIGFVDNDDWVDKHMYEYLYTVAHSKNADIVECGFVETSDRNYSVEQPSNYDVSRIILDDSERKRLIIWHYVMVWIKIYKREFILEHELFFEPQLCFEDIVWWPLAISYAKSMYRVNKNLYYHYKHSGSVSALSDREHHYDRLELLPKLLEQARTRGIYERFKDALDVYFSIMYYANSLPALINHMSKVKLDKLYASRLRMLDILPDYWQNPYLKNLDLENYGRVVMSLMDTDPRIAFIYAKICYKPEG